MTKSDEPERTESSSSEDVQPVGPPDTPPYSDVDLDRWRDYDHVWTDSLWLIDSRDATGGHELYPPLAPNLGAIQSADPRNSSDQSPIRGRRGNAMLDLSLFLIIIVAKANRTTVPEGEPQE